jgi:4-amino-4-deoxy-L-arabinose transferase-like glycosyltransferase
VIGYGPVLLVLVASAVVLGLGLHEAWGDAPTFDEPVYVSAGLAAVLHHDLAFNDEHPVLPKVVAVLPVLFTHPVVPANGHWDQNDERTYSAAFVKAQLRAGTLRSVTMASRVIPLLEAIGLAFILYALGRDLFGRAAGALAGLLWLLSPFVLGLAHLDSVDISFSLAVGCWSWALLRWTRQPTRARAVVVGLMSGLTVLTDVTGLILAGVAVTALAAVLWRGSRRHALTEAGLVALVAWASVWIVYAAIDPGVLLHPTIVLPAPYFEGIRYLASNDTIPGPGYLLGVAWTGGRWWYWPGILAVKTVPTTLLVLLVGPWGLLAADGGTRRRAALVLGLPAILLTAFTVGLPRDIGLRYLLPVIALWLVLATSIVPVVRKRAVGAALVVAVVVAGAVTIGSSPDSLAWTTPPFTPAFQVATNSDVDWGQSLYLLQQWSRGKEPRVAYFGPRGVNTGAIPGARSLLATTPSRLSGWVAVSATDLTSADADQLAWLRAYCPVGQLGDSILIYRFRGHPSAQPGPTRPAGICSPDPSGFSSRVS